MKIQSLPGFRDFDPERMALRNHIFRTWRDVATAWGFEEYDGPPLEPLDLYIEKSGPEIVEQLFNFTDKGGREVSLRPEMTPTVVRMLGSRIKGMPMPVRWFSMPQLFRYEKQQRGRLREHFQLNMDIVGETSVDADADLLCAALEVLRRLGLTSEDVVARISDRRILRQILLESGIAESALPVAYNVIDKVERDSRETCLKRLSEIGVDPDTAGKVLDFADLSLADVAREFPDSRELAGIRSELESYFSAIESLGFSDWVRFDMKIVRGLAYYTGIVFEIFDRKGELRAICGGGRYDDLFASLTDSNIPALGFGFGDVVLGELLKDRDLIPEPPSGAEMIVIPVDDSVRATALRLVAALRRQGHRVVFPYGRSGVGKMLRKASSQGIGTAWILGPDELERDEVKMRNLESGEESSHPLAELLREGDG